MNYKVFFAYQSDIEEIYSKGFIKEAFYIVISEFKKERINIELDFGMRKSPGNTILIDEMLRKSRESDLVIVDMTFTSAKEWLDAEIIDEDDKCKWISIPKGDRKPSPNPNVLLETGYAWSQKGFERTVLLMNIAFGSADELPVDLKGFRWAISYNLNESNYSERKQK
ncbi:MAG: nucleotide-binding protein, partial [Bacteroidales bacterium]|nr:nucleotide-binding protein [Bacteroidales bacterium]